MNYILIAGFPDLQINSMSGSDVIWEGQTAVTISCKTEETNLKSLTLYHNNKILKGGDADQINSIEVEIIIHLYFGIIVWQKSKVLKKNFS